MITPPDGAMSVDQGRGNAEDQAFGSYPHFQNTSTNQLYMWFLNGTGLSTSSYLSPNSVTGTWQIVGGT